MLSLAIGREGQNARLAARLTGWRIDIRSDVSVAQAKAEAAEAETTATTETPVAAGTEPAKPETAESPALKPAAAKRAAVAKEEAAVEAPAADRTATSRSIPGKNRRRPASCPPRWIPSSQPAGILINCLSSV